MFLDGCGPMIHDGEELRVSLNAVNPAINATSIEFLINGRPYNINILNLFCCVEPQSWTLDHVDNWIGIINTNTIDICMNCIFLELKRLICHIEIIMKY